MTPIPADRIDAPTEELSPTSTASTLSSSSASRRRNYRYYEFIMAAFVAIMICSNFISARKRVEIGGWVFGAGVLFFPVSYLFGDILTEVYGYARSRRVVWAGFGALGFASFMSWVVLSLPADPTWRQQPAFEAVFGSAWRVVVASMLAFFTGELVNSYTLAKMKIWTRGRFLWMRTIGSTIAGEAADTLIFVPIAFWGLADWPLERVWAVIKVNYVLKVGWEIVATPLTYKVVGYLKRAEREDFYDYGTDFTPFSLQD